MKTLVSKTTKRTVAKTELEQSLDLRPQFPEDFKKLLKYLLSKAVELIDSNDIADSGDVGIVCAHLRDVANQVGCGGAYFDLGLVGDLTNLELCQKLQAGCHGEWRVPWAKILNKHLSCSSVEGCK